MCHTPASTPAHSPQLLPAAIWGTSALLCSFDGLNVFRPWSAGSGGKAHWRTRGGWFHVDQNPRLRPGRHCVQGLVTLTDCTEASGGLVVIPVRAARSGGGGAVGAREWGMHRLSAAAAWFDDRDRVIGLNRARRRSSSPSDVRASLRTRWTSSRSRATISRPLCRSTANPEARQRTARSCAPPCSVLFCSDLSFFSSAAPLSPAQCCSAPPATSACGTRAPFTATRPDGRPSPPLRTALLPPARAAAAPSRDPRPSRAGAAPPQPRVLLQLLCPAAAAVVAVALAPTLQPHNPRHCLRQHLCLRLRLQKPRPPSNPHPRRPHRCRPLPLPLPRPLRLQHQAPRLVRRRQRRRQRARLRGCCGSSRTSA